MNPNRRRPPRRGDTTETSIDKSRRDVSANISRLLEKSVASPRDDSVDHNRTTALQKSVITSNEVSFYQSMIKDVDNTSFIERFSTRCNDYYYFTWFHNLMATAQVKDQTVMPDISQAKNLKVTSKQILGDITKAIEVSKQYVRDVIHFYL